MARRSPRQPFITHVEELRGRLFASLLVLLAGTALGYLLRDVLLRLLIAPLNQPLYYSSPGGGFNFILQLCVGFGVLVAIPVLVFHLLRFVGPVLPRHTGWFVTGSLLSSCLLVGAGIAFAYLVSLPAALHFLNAFATDQVHALISTDTYLSFVLLYLAAFAVLFQLPLVLLIINKVVPLRPRTLLKQTRWVILVSFVLAALITPTQDPLNQSLMAGPVIGMYLLSVALVWLINGLRRPLPGVLDNAELVEMQPVWRRGREGFLCLWQAGKGRHTRELVTFLYRGQHQLLHADPE